MRRRDFLRSAAVAGAAAFAAVGPPPAAAEPPPETKKLRIVREASICYAPIYVAEGLLGAEGFTDVHYVPIEAGLGPGQMLGAGKADFGIDAVPPVVMNLDAGDPILILAGVHVGCYELFGTDQVRAVRDLKGRTIAVRSRP